MALGTTSHRYITSSLSININNSEVHFVVWRLKFISSYTLLVWLHCQECPKSIFQTCSQSLSLASIWTCWSCQWTFSGEYSGSLCHFLSGVQMLRWCVMVDVGYIVILQALEGHGQPWNGQWFLVPQDPPLTYTCISDFVWAFPRFPSFVYKWSVLLSEVPLS